MWRAHFVVLGHLPAEDALQNLADGYQLFHETRTGLYYLTAHSEPLGRRPNFGGFLEREIAHRADLSPLERFLAEDHPALDLKSYEVSFELVHRTATLSLQLAMPVLAAELTDDEYAMAVMADKGRLEYLRFRTTLKAGMEDADLVEVTYTPAAGFTLAGPVSGQMHGLAAAAIADVFAVSGEELDKYADAKPTRDAGKRVAARLGVPAEVWLDSFGVFKRISHAPPRLTLATRLLIPLRYAASLLLLPFLFAGTLALVLVYSGKPNADWTTSTWRLLLAGLAVLAIPIVIVALLVRAVLGM